MAENPAVHQFGYHVDGPAKSDKPPILRMVENLLILGCLPSILWQTNIAIENCHL